jgi:hypothetical protein
MKNLEGPHGYLCVGTFQSILYMSAISNSLEWDQKHYLTVVTPEALPDSISVHQPKELLALNLTNNLSKVDVYIDDFITVNPDF